MDVVVRVNEVPISFAPPTNTISCSSAPRLPTLFHWRGFPPFVLPSLSSAYELEVVSSKAYNTTTDSVSLDDGASPKPSSPSVASSHHFG
ncbi:hypothetical protein HHK36_005464 [Tetracentron sinense]|uniref:Uncharacterized protein n=1 Tax=Tetracentron sinense TaxID=13715 RepID=A0A834ZL31_TETSI|nr:hypothetical protein HHK36_005464 [Tetracentron sinense]